ncbi:hypothetical protein ACWERI_20035 [Streptomyces collinus]
MTAQDAQDAGAAGPDSFRIHQIADRFEVYGRGGSSSASTWRAPRRSSRSPS